MLSNPSSIYTYIWFSALQYRQMQKKARKSSGDQANALFIIKVLIGCVFFLLLTSTYFSIPTDDFKQPALPVSTNNQTIRNRNQEVFEEYSQKHVLVKTSKAVTCGAENMQLLRGEVLAENNKYEMTLLMTKEAPEYYSLCLGDVSQQHTVEFTLLSGQCDILISVSAHTTPRHRRYTSPYHTTPHHLTMVDCTSF